MSKRSRIAAITSIYYPMSHADSIITKFMKGMSTDEGFFAPEVDLVSIYLDHVLDSDIGVDLVRLAREGLSRWEPASVGLLDRLGDAVALGHCPADEIRAQYRGDPAALLRRSRVA